jgi:hypothetical protein
VLVHHLLYLGGSRHVENVFEAEVFADDRAHILALLGRASEALYEVALQEWQPVVVGVAEIIDGHVEAVRDVVLIAVDLVIDYDTIAEQPVAFASCEEVKVLDLVALLIRRAMLSGKDV